jgi:hypothetical protein
VNVLGGLRRRLTTTSAMPSTETPRAMKMRLPTDPHTKKVSSFGRRRTASRATRFASPFAAQRGSARLPPPSLPARAASFAECVKLVAKIATVVFGNIGR